MAGILHSLTNGLTITKYSDWLIFVERLNEAVRTGRIRQVPVVKSVWCSDEEWFLDPETDEIFAYCAPNPPAMPTWQRVDPLKQSGDYRLAPLSVFETGPVTVMTAHFMKMRIEILVARRLVEALTPPCHVALSSRGTEKWFKDIVSNITYRLIECYGLGDKDDIRWEVIPSAELSRKIQ